MTPDQIKAAAQRNRAKKAEEIKRLLPVKVAAKNAATLLRERAKGAQVRIAEVKQMNDLIHIDGFFPTPKKLVNRMLELAQVRPSMRFLEPSAGKGDIADAVRAAASCCTIDVCEINYRLQEILRRKNYTIVGDDFMKMMPMPLYDRVIMNPSFEHGQDRIQVRHAYDMLAQEGRLVAIVSEGCFSRSLKADCDFRTWLDDIGADWEQNPKDAFSGAGSERHTGVQTRIITIEKPYLYPTLLFIFLQRV